MSDYGFKTLDNRSEVLNAKYPIFGYDLGHSKATFKSIVATEGSTPEPPLPDFGWPSFPTYTESYGMYDHNDVGKDPWALQPNYSVYQEKLIYEYEHGYNFKPIVYSKVSCNLRARTKIMVSRSNAAAWGDFAGRTLGSFTKTYTSPNQFVYECPTAVNSLAMAINYDMGEYLDNSFFGYYDSLDAWYNTYYGSFNNMPVQLRFEVDDKKVKIYRRYFYTASKSRAYYHLPANYFYYGYPDSALDSYQWSKEWPDLAGTEYTIEMMIMPYSKEDLEDVV